MTERPVAIVTGGARGIGRSIALLLAKNGYAVVINSVRSSGDDIKRDIEAAGGVAEAIRADISIPADRKLLVTQTLNRFGQINLLVNNAGVAPDVRADVLEAGEESFD